jgi:predicted RNA-binding Zn-ribbon protein involved in translation (DUF1610 family)
MTFYSGGGFRPREYTPPGPKSGPSKAALYQRMRELEHELQRVRLLNQAMWEILRERARVTDADLEKRAQEIDMRDGVEDGRMTETALKCPQCGRVSNSRHWKCLYCGLDFEKPAMG